MVTEPEVHEIEDTSMLEIESHTAHSVSREETMVEHSVVLNEEDPVHDEAVDYL